jgi:hypothetical protein
MKELILVLSNKDLDSLGAVRNIPYLQAAYVEDNIWVKGIREPNQYDTKLRKLPSIVTYTLDMDGNLFPLDKITPNGKIDNLNWIPISEFIKVDAPTSALPGKAQDTYKIKLVKATEIKEGAALLTTLSLWKNFADNASEVRLNQLRFAVSKNKEVLIMGSPLPNIPGKEYWVRDHILLPSGYDFEIPLISSLLLLKYNSKKDSVLFFDEKGEYQKIGYDCFMQSTRSAVRLTEVM